LKTFRTLFSYVFAVSAGLAGGVVLSLAVLAVGLMVLLDTGTTHDEMEAAVGRCESLLRTTHDRLERDRAPR